MRLLFEAMTIHHFLCTSSEIRISNTSYWKNYVSNRSICQTCDRSEILSCNCPWGGRCTLYFFLLTAPLFLPLAAGHGEPVNSRVRLLWVVVQVRVQFQVKRKRPLCERSFSFGIRTPFQTRYLTNLINHCNIMKYCYAIWNNLTIMKYFV